MDAVVLLHWIPLGAGGHVVRRCGRLYERLAASVARRPPVDLFHAALELDVDGTHHTVEMGPVWNVPVRDRGACVEGPVGLTWLGRSRAFRYEVRCWRDGTIPDLAWAAASSSLATDPARARRLLSLVPSAPAPTWGRDELRLGEMWNSNSLVSWLLASSGHPVEGLAPPRSGRAPGWDAGLALAARQQAVRGSERGR
jgi:hypothetical protein